MKKSYLSFQVIFCLLIFSNGILGQGNTLIVTSTADSGAGSLRDAITNAVSGDSITFDQSVFPPDNPATIYLEGPLPAVKQGNLIIDASLTGVLIDGSAVTIETNGLSIVSSDNSIRGLHFNNFTLADIALNNGAQNNIIGGDRTVGNGPSGQGNLLTGAGTFGIGMWGESTSNNTILGNIIGADKTGTVRQGNFSGGIFLDGPKQNLIENNLISGYNDNGVHIGGGEGYNTVRDNFINPIMNNIWSNGISIDNSGFNTIGPGNEISNNGMNGIWILRENSRGNKITQNSIYDNAQLGIILEEGGNAQLPAPVLLDFEKQTGNISGIACANCTVEIFSDNDDEGEFYEGKTLADNDGNFSFNKGTAFKNVHLTTTATDNDGNTSPFSLYTPDISQSKILLQEGNTKTISTIKTKTSAQLEDNRIGDGWELKDIFSMGAKRARLSLNDIEEIRVDWSKSEFEIPEDLDNRASELVAHGVIPYFTMSFWDKANHPDGWKEEQGFSRFQNEKDIQRYLEFAKFIVNHFKDRIDYYELWNEPDNGGFPIQCIRTPDYINLVEQVVPVIREVHPEAKIMVGTVSGLRYSKWWLDGIVDSDRIMPLVDVICWHPFYGESPADEVSKDYYYNYPSTIQALKDTASNHGFKGEYFAGEVGWLQDGQPFTTDPKVSSLIQAAKYYSRSIITHLGLDVTIAGIVMPPYTQPDFSTIRNLCTIFSGNKPDTIEVDIQCEEINLKCYSFSLSNNNKLIGLWRDGIAEDFDYGVPGTLTIHGFNDKKVVAIDVLTGIEQELITEIDGDNLVINNLLIKDYPIILRISSSTVGIDDIKNTQPGNFSLSNFPIPFSSSTTIMFQILTKSNVSIKIYNLQGQVIRNLVKKEFEPGVHNIKWNGLDNMGNKLATGMYLIRMESENYVKTNKCLLK